MEAIQMKDMLGCCGLDCESCDTYKATINNDDELREKTAKLWSELNKITITKEMINCVGCRMDGVKTYYCSEMCGIRKCALGKGYKTCGECSEMEKCKTVAEIHQNSDSAKSNLK